jgi:nitrite reductase (NADH) small subunit
MTALDQVTTWSDVCLLDDLTPDRGVCALVGHYQVAVFLLRDGSLHALSNYDPFSEAYVLSRGIVGSRGDRPTVASPVYKQRFDLVTGTCVDDPSVAVMSFPVRVAEGRVSVGLP